MRKHKHQEPEPDKPNVDTVENEGPVDSEPPKADPLQEEVARLQQENQALKDQLLRVMADLQNMRKRHLQEKQGLQQFAAEEIVVALLPVLDNMDRMMASAEKGASLESLHEGAVAIDRQLRSVLEARKLVRIPSVGAKFDEQLHHAVVMHVEEGAEDGTISEELQAGYMLGDKVIRPANVRVVKGS